jgi:hypothetical protein
MYVLTEIINSQPSYQKVYLSEEDCMVDFERFSSRFDDVNQNDTSFIRTVSGSDQYVAKTDAEEYSVVVKKHSISI